MNTNPINSNVSKSFEADVVKWIIGFTGKMTLDNSISNTIARQSQDRFAHLLTQWYKTVNV